MIQRPDGMGKFQFTILSTLRAAQLIRGCRPLIESTHKPTVTAQWEVAEGLITQLLTPLAPLAAAISADVPALAAHAASEPII